MRPARIDNLTRIELALLWRLQRQIEEATVGGALAAGEADGICHPWILFGDVDNARRCRLHRWKRSVLRALDAAENRAVVLLRKKSLRHDHEKKNVHGHRDQKNYQRDSRMTQHGAQTPFIRAEQPREQFFAHAVQRSTFFRPLMPQ